MNKMKLLTLLLSCILLCSSLFSCQQVAPDASTGETNDTQDTQTESGDPSGEDCTGGPLFAHLSFASWETLLTELSIRSSTGIHIQTGKLIDDSTLVDHPQFRAWLAKIKIDGFLYVPYWGEAPLEGKETLSLYESTGGYANGAPYLIFRTNSGLMVSIYLIAQESELESLRASIRLPAKEKTLQDHTKITVYSSVESEGKEALFFYGNYLVDIQADQEILTDEWYAQLHFEKATLKEPEEIRHLMFCFREENATVQWVIYENMLWSASSGYSLHSHYRKYRWSDTLYEWYAPDMGESLYITTGVNEKGQLVVKDFEWFATTKTLHMVYPEETPIEIAPVEVNGKVVKQGMTDSQLTETLGEPTRTLLDGTVRVWNFGNSSSLFVWLEEKSSGNCAVIYYEWLYDKEAPRQADSKEYYTLFPLPESYSLPQRWEE